MYVEHGNRSEREHHKQPMQGASGGELLTYSAVRFRSNTIGLAYSTKSSIKTGQAPMDIRVLLFMCVSRDVHVCIHVRMCVCMNWAVISPLGRGV